MRFTVEPWAPEYGTPVDGDLLESETQPDVDVEVAGREWRPIRPAAGVEADDVLFVDGVRRVDANLWIEGDGDVPVLGLCATYAAGAVRSRVTVAGKAAEVVECAVERGVFTAAGVAREVVTGMATYEVRPTSGTTAEELWLGIQQRMGELEGRIAARHTGAEVVLVDGPLSHRRMVDGAVGYIKTQRVHYLPPALRPVLASLEPGTRTPLFLTTTSWSRYSWYARLAATGSPVGGIVRCEIEAGRDTSAAAAVADRVTATLPRFASDGHKDPRAPQNLYPIGGLERALRRRLGDQHLLYRALRRAAA